MNTVNVYASDAKPGRFEVRLTTSKGGPRLPCGDAGGSCRIIGKSHASYSAASAAARATGYHYTAAWDEQS